MDPRPRRGVFFFRHYFRVAEDRIALVFNRTHQVDSVYVLGVLLSMIEIRQTAFYEDWFDSLRDRNARMRINVRIRRITLGNLGDVKSVGDGVSEIRIDYGPGYRVYFVQKSDHLIVLLGGGDKSSQVRDIKKAQEIALQLEKLR